MGDIIISNNCYYREKITVKGEEIEKQLIQISNFVMKIIQRIQYDEYTEDVIKITNNKNFSVIETFKLDVFSGLRKFKEFLCKKHSCFNWFGRGDYELEKVKEIMNNESFPIVKGVNVLGIHEDEKGNKYFVDDNGCIDQGLNKCECFKLNLDNPWKVKKTFKKDLLTKNDGLILSEKLFNFNIDKIVFPLLASSSMMFLNYSLNKLNYKIPNLCFCGESGGAKTETKDNILKPIMHYFDDQMAALFKEFVSIKRLSETNLFPLSIEEYKIWTMDDRHKALVLNLVRSAYDGHSSDRGRADQLMNCYDYKTNILLTGESYLHEKSDKERSIILHFAKMYHSPENTKIFKYLKDNSILLEKFGNNLLHESLNTKDEDIRKQYNNNIKYIEKHDLPSRMAHEINMLAIGYSNIIKVFKRLNIDILPLNKAIDIFIQSQKDFNLTNNSNTNSIVEDTLEAWGDMINSRVIFNNKDFTFYVVNDDDLYISLKLLWPEFTRYLKQYNLTGAFHNKRKDFLEELKKTKYYKADSVKAPGTNNRFLQLNLKEIKNKNLDMFDFTKDIIDEFEDGKVRQIRA